MVLYYEAERMKNGQVFVNFSKHQEDNCEKLKEIYYSGIIETIEIRNAFDEHVFEKQTAAFKAALRDLKNKESDLYKKIYMALNDHDSEDFWVCLAWMLLKNIARAEFFPYIGREGKTFAAYTYVDCCMKYFKFNITQKALAEAIGEGTALMAMNVPHIGVWMHELGPQKILDYASGEYYYWLRSEYDKNNTPDKVLRWMDFEISLD